MMSLITCSVAQSSTRTTMSHSVLVVVSLVVFTIYYTEYCKNLHTKTDNPHQRPTKDSIDNRNTELYPNSSNNYKPQETRKSYRSGLKLFFTYTSGETLPKRNYLNELDTLSIEYLTTKPDIEQDYVRFQNHLKTRYAPKTVELRKLAVRSYLDANNIQLKPSFLKRVNGNKKVEPISEEKIPTQTRTKTYPTAPTTPHQNLHPIPTERRNETRRTINP